MRVVPRQKYLKINEKGFYIELALFGKFINELSYEESLYILNLKNYEKSLEDFKKGFESLEEEDLIINGPFQYLNIKGKPFEKNRKEKGILVKKPINENIRKYIKINVPLKYDIKGRNFTKEDILFYSDPNFIYQN